VTFAPAARKWILVPFKNAIGQRSYRSGGSCSSTSPLQFRLYFKFFNRAGAYCGAIRGAEGTFDH
jgi:hypothetical protein